jgi:steroid 5-alpha reductase family enzyme
MSPVLLYSLFFLVVALGYATIWFCISLYKQRADIADIAWGVGGAVFSLLALALADSPTLRSYIVALFVTCWGVRLAHHIYNRNKNKPEDARYVAMRSSWGDFAAVRIFLQIFTLQSILLLFVLISTFTIILSDTPRTLTLWDIIGSVIWLIGFYFEATGDKQLSTFLANPLNKGKIMTTGLWRYTRHPNYFGEMTQWIGIFIISLSVPFGFVTIISPLLISYLLLHVSGIPMLEKRYEGNKDYEAYKKVTPALFPKEWFVEKMGKIKIKN